MHIQPNEAYLEWAGVDLSGICTERVAVPPGVIWPRRLVRELLEPRQAVMRLTDVVWEFNILYSVAAVPLLQAGRAGNLVWEPQGRYSNQPKVQLFAMLTARKTHILEEGAYMLVVLRFVAARMQSRTVRDDVFTDLA